MAKCETARADRPAQSATPPVVPLSAPPIAASAPAPAHLSQQRVLRWVYTGRLVLATAIFVAALAVWRSAPWNDTLVTTLAMLLALVFTAGSWLWSNVYHRAPGRTFLTLQVLVDLAIVTAAVHVTGGRDSQFAALYILVIVTAALLLPTGGALLISLLGCVLYFADALLAPGRGPDAALALQLGVFGIVALGSALISVRLQEAGAGTAELAAELSRVRLEAADILHNIRSGVVTIDDEGNLLYANPAAGSLLGVALEERVGQPILDEIGLRSPTLALALVRTARHGERITRAEGTILGTTVEFPIGVTTTSATTQGERPAVTATAIFQDISDQKRLNELHTRAERLEAIAELGASMAHEIKNPLAAIRSAVEQLAGMAGKGSDAATLSGLIVRESDRLSRLLTEFLDFARVRVTRIRPVDVGGVVRDAVALVGRHPERHAGTRIEMSAPETPLVVEGDDDLLHRVVFNLLLNAVQASPEHGRVTIDASAVADDQVPLGMSFEHGAVALRVTDEGPGIAPEIRDRLFDPFFTTKPGGSGLGLAIVHRAIEAHRGVVYTDRVGDTTRFTALLPRAAQGEPA